MSKAFKSRCSQVKLNRLALTDMELIMQQMEEVQPSLPYWLGSRLHQLWIELEKQKSPMQLTLEDLILTAQQLMLEPENNWQEIFNDLFSLHFRSIKGTMLLPEAHRDQVILDQETEKKRQYFERIVNSAIKLSSPIKVRWGRDLNYSNNTLTITNKTTGQEVINWIAKKDNEVFNDKHISTSCNTSDGKNVQKVVFGKVTQVKHFEINSYFPNEIVKPVQYRLKLSQYFLNDAGELLHSSIRGEDDLLFPDQKINHEVALRTDLKPRELPGRICLILDNQWQPLPSLTPKDQLHDLRVFVDGKPIEHFELAKSTITGQIFIRNNLPTTIPVTVEFIITPQQSYFAELKQGENVLLKEDLCNETQKQFFDHCVFAAHTDNHPSLQELRSINDIVDIPQRLNALRDWLDTFSANKNLDGENDSLLLKIIKEKQGVLWP